MRISAREVAEVRDICDRLNEKNRQYILAVAHALQFSQEHTHKNRQQPPNHRTT